MNKQWNGWMQTDCMVVSSDHINADHNGEGKMLDTTCKFVYHNYVE